MEDVAIAYGYNNLPRRIPTTVTVGRELPLNQLCELLRLESAMAGFTEILTWALCSRMENFDSLRRTDDGCTAVSIGNPATAEFEVCRTSLLPGALKTLGEWRHPACSCSHIVYHAWCCSPALPYPLSNLSTRRCQQGCCVACETFRDI